MTTVTVDLASRPYDIIVEPGLLQRAGDYVAPLALQGRVLVVTDSNVATTVLPQLVDSLKSKAITAECHVLPAGEDSKNWRQLEAITEWMLSHEIERSDHVIALGGGVVGDITGFATHIAKRGCQFIQIPTTLLAQVDSSVGGKTAINGRSGKNLIGAFHQPSLVLVDPDVLATLPTRQLASGFAEAVKYGLINDAPFFDYCSNNLDAFFEGDVGVRERIIVHSVTAKAKIVAADEHELTGIRALLNLGHTFGHALEAETGFSDLLLHGEAVAAGMALAFRYSAHLGLCDHQDAARVASVLQKAGLPTTIKAARVNAGGAQLVAHMLHDKKRSGGNLPFLLARGIGATFLSKDVELADLTLFLDSDASSV
jgi:3-dehydroquinate synthase